MINTNGKQPTENGDLSAVFIKIQIVCHVLSFRLVNSYRLQSSKDEGATFLRNVGMCYITPYTAPDYRRKEFSERSIRYTQK